MFNGKDLSGWTPKIAHYDLGDNYGNTFRVENGLLEVRYDKKKYPTFDGRFGHLFYKDPFSYYRLVVEYRFVGEQVPGAPAWALRNSGAMLHSPDPRTMPRDQNFPISIEGQLLGGNSDGKPRPNGQHVQPGYGDRLPGQAVSRSLPELFLAHLRRRPVGARGIRSAWVGHDDQLRERPESAGIRDAAVRRRRGRQLQHHDQARRPAHRERLHLAAGRVASHRLPQGGVAQSRRLHGQGCHQLQELLHQERAGGLQVRRGRRSPPCGGRASTR